jgi:hypothetical protein
MKNRNISRKTEYDLKLIKNYFAPIGEIPNVHDSVTVFIICQVKNYNHQRIMFINT